jgi:hypothetical protein
LEAAGFIHWQYLRQQQQQLALVLRCLTRSAKPAGVFEKHSIPVLMEKIARVTNRMNCRQDAV